MRKTTSAHKYKNMESNMERLYCIYAKSNIFNVFSRKVQSSCSHDYGCIDHICPFAREKFQVQADLACLEKVAIAKKIEEELLTK